MSLSSFICLDYPYYASWFVLIGIRQLASSRKLSVNKLIEELSMAALAEFDAETRFRVQAAWGNPEAGLRLLDRLDRAG